MLRRSILIRIAVYGGLVVLAATIWAWALGFAALHGAVAGAALGLAVGIFLDGMMKDFWEPGDLSSMAARYWGLRMSR